MSTVISKGSRQMEIRRGDGVDGWKRLKSLMDLREGDSFRVVSPKRRTVNLIYRAVCNPFLQDNIPVIEVEKVYQYTGWVGFRRPSNNRPWGSRKKIKDKRVCHHMSPLEE